jgi:hypothetical protein
VLHAIPRTYLVGYPRVDDSWVHNLYPNAHTVT